MMNSKILIYIALALSLIFPAVNGLSSLTIGSDIGQVYAQQQEQEPNINATSLYNTKTMILGNNVKNLVILIPAEGHHGPGEEDEARFIDQQFIPQTAIINQGTTVTWLNSDAGHEYTVTVNDPSNSTLFTTELFEEHQTSNTFAFNNTGTFTYQAPGDEEVVMNGQIIVDAIESPIATLGNSTDNTVGVLMVPTQDIGEYIQDLETREFSIHDTFDFKDLRGGQGDVEDTQTLIIWTSGQALTNILTQLSEVSETLPYE